MPIIKKGVRFEPMKLPQVEHQELRRLDSLKEKKTVKFDMSQNRIPEMEQF